jgi:hypothetical protein
MIVKARRDFIKTAMGLGCGMALSASGSPAAVAPEDAEAKVRAAVERMRKAEMAEKAGLFKKLRRKYGGGVVDEVRDYVVEGARERLAAADLKTRDLDAVLELVWKSMGGEIEWRIAERTPDRLAIRVSRCLYAREMRRHDAAEIGYAFYCAWDDGFCRGLNPKMTFTRTRTLMRGDDGCDHTYTLEPA